MMRKAWILALVAALTTAAHSQGNSDSPREFSPGEVASAALRPGDRIVVTGKYKERFDRELYLYDCPVPFLVNNKTMSRKLRDFTPKIDNLTLEGEIAADGTLDRVVNITKLSAGATDLTMLEAQLAQLLETERSSEKVIAFVKDLRQRGERYEPADIDAVSYKGLRQIHERLKTTGASVEERLAVIDEGHELLQDRPLTLKSLLDVARDHPEHAKVRELLLKFRCRKYRGEWMSHEEFKEREGLVFHRDRWMSTGEKALLEALEGFLKNPPNLLLLRRRTEREYELMSSAGKVEPGMTREEIQASLGFPDRVRRRAYKEKEFDQWCYDDDCYYLFNGLLVQAPQEP